MRKKSEVDEEYVGMLRKMGYETPKILKAEDLLERKVKSKAQSARNASFGLRMRQELMMTSLLIKFMNFGSGASSGVEW